ncbi:GxxExxY protein [Belliella buryatensis]|jgi:GxxExxY protein|uniref:GxxExxY protein n=1 Tax=Belliella buryatensis TaxID=1500549 RepID=A0A239CSE0_9BACT|nr:GxxExxY protein [Belliella buryatensis]SNS23040.1 GxxExxY protein [Belliella buryatensis]
MFPLSLNTEDIAHTTIGCAIEVHKNLGPGLLESTYQKCLSYELTKVGLIVEEEVLLPLRYKEIELEKAYRIDMMIENKLIIENKTVEKITDVHIAQLLTYLKLTENKLGLIINWKSKILKGNIKRVIL